jgi:hypothetical protein
LQNSLAPHLIFDGAAFGVIQFATTACRADAGRTSLATAMPASGNGTFQNGFGTRGADIGNEIIAGDVSHVRRPVT